MSEVTLEKIVSLAKRRGFVFPGSEIYGGLANSWDYGPLGVELKNNIKKVWWERFVHRRDDMVGIDAALIMNPKVWEASGHLATFSDPLVECKKCHARFREDHIVADFITSDISVPVTEANQPIKKFIECEKCHQKGTLDQVFTESRNFNLMLKTFLGPAEEKANEVFFRPETAQAMFVDFKQVLETTRRKLPFGIAQIGKAFRNEITPGNFIFRMREFEQMEIEYFIRESDWESSFEYWRNQMHEWMEHDLGLDMGHVHELEVPKDELAHYSKRTIDFEYDYPFGKKELYGLAYRGDFDLRNHFKDTPPYKEEGSDAFYPHVIEPTWGVDRSVLAVLCDAYTEDGDRVYLKIKPRLAPYKAAVFPLLANKPALVEKAREIYTDLRKHFIVAWDDRGNVGKRYYSQDEIGTPYCITVDFDTLGEGNNGELSARGGSSLGGKDTVTIRHRDTAKQERVNIGELANFLRKNIYE